MWIARILGEVSQTLERVPKETHWLHAGNYIRVDITIRRDWEQRLQAAAEAQPAEAL
jgi:hypothetical protein